MRSGQNSGAEQTSPRAIRCAALMLALAVASALATMTSSAATSTQVTPAKTTPTANAQRDPALREVVAKAITQAECFIDRNDSAVWYKLMEPRLRRIVADQNERLEILKLVYCETQRPGEVRLPPGLVMAMIDVESRFNRYAVSSAGAVGLMQVMPFWPEQLGMRRYELTHLGPNIRMGCAIFRHYLEVEHKNVQKALARYNGSVGHRDYPDLIVNRWTRWNGADDMGLPPPATQAVVKSRGS